MIRLLAATTAMALLAACDALSPADNPAAPANQVASNQANSADTVAVDAATAKRVMHERHEGMEQIGKSAKALRAQLAGDTPDLAVVRQSAATIADLSQKASNWFPAGTGPSVGKTGAKEEIWQKPDDFQAKLRDFQAAAKAFNATAQAGDVPAIKAGFADLGKTCKACHDNYRSEEKH
jgi:cytochrome c556